MKFSKKCKLHRAAGDSGQFVFDQVMLVKGEGGRAHLYATNGSILARVPVFETENDTAGLLPSDAIAEATKGKVSDEAEVIANGVVRVRTSKGFVEMSRGDASGQWPDPESIEGSIGEPMLSIGLNPRMLFALAEALGSADGVRIDFAGPKVPFRVVAIQGDSNAKPSGVMMPIGLDK